MENDYNDKVSRVLSLYQRLMEGEVIDKKLRLQNIACLRGQSREI